MTKIIKNIATSIVVSGLIVVVSANADQKMTSAARSIYNSLNMSDFELEYMYSSPAASLKYNKKTKAFKELKNVNVLKHNGHAQINKINEYDGECVSFVKALTGYYDNTTFWEKSQRIEKDGYTPPKWSAIATFPNGSYSGHTAIFIRKENNYIVVFDQNWNYKGYASIHYIYFNGRNDKSDAGAYYTIEGFFLLPRVKLLVKFIF